MTSLFHMCSYRTLNTPLTDRHTNTYTHNWHTRIKHTSVLYHTWHLTNTNTQRNNSAPVINDFVFHSSDNDALGHFFFFRCIHCGTNELIKKTSFQIGIKTFRAKTGKTKRFHYLETRSLSTCSCSAHATVHTITWSIFSSIFSVLTHLLPQLPSVMFHLHFDIDAHMRHDETFSKVHLLSLNVLFITITKEISIFKIKCFEGKKRAVPIS